MNPCRVPTWRWLRARHILDGGPGTTARLDGPQGRTWINRAVEFQIALSNCRNERERLSLADTFPDIFWAHWLWNNNQHCSKWAIEAYMLARETNQQIGRRARCSPEIIEAYEAIFFNVREKLNHREYIIHTVIMGGSVHPDLTERNVALLWKLFGYHAGPLVLDALIEPLVNANLSTQPREVPAFFQNAAVNRIKRQAAIAALTVPVDTDTASNLIKAFVKQVEVERTTDGPGKTQPDIRPNIEAMLSLLPFPVGNIDKRYVQDE